MRSVNKTVYVEPSYSQTRIQVRPIPQQSQQQSILSQSRERVEQERQKTEQSVRRYISPNALKSINQQLYQVVSMDPRTAQSNLRRSAKMVYDIIDNELLLSIKHLSNMKLLMYDTILMYVQQYSQHEKDKFEWRQKEKSLLNSVKNAVSMRQQEVALQAFNPVLLTNNNKQLQNLKETVPFVPKDKSKMQKSARRDLVEEELNAKIESTKQSLENILKKIQHYNNYRLTGEDIIRLKRSVANVSQLQPVLFINMGNESPIKGQKGTNSMQNSRPLSREGRSRQQSSSKTRQQQKSRTYNKSSLNQPQTANTSSLQPSRTAHQLPSDNQQQANRLLIQQLQQIIQKKENRMRQLTRELSKNLADKMELEKTIENFQVQIGEIEGERRNFHLVIEKLEEENLNYQLEIKELREGEILRKEVGKMQGTYHQQQGQEMSQYHMLRDFQIKQKAFKFAISKQLDITIQHTPLPTAHNLQSESTQKNANSLSGVIPINDISQITPKRLSKRLMLPPQIQQSYIYESQVITKRRNIAATQNRSKEKSKDQSLSKYKIISGSRTQMKSKNQLDYSSLAEVRDNERQDYQKVLFLQALTIEQILQDI